MTYINIGRRVEFRDNNNFVAGIATADDKEKAHFLAKAANAYKEPEIEGELKLDCYLKAEEGEPKFTLLARDPLSAHIIALWAAMRKGDTASAVIIFADMIADPGYNYRAKSLETDSSEKLASACDIARAMIEWRNEKKLEAFEVHFVA